MKDKILELKNIKKIYHEKQGEIIALDNISFNVKDKEFISIIGPSGCGKSTILSILANIESLTQGEIKIKNKVKVGYMLQQDSLFPWKTVLENCYIGLKIQKQDTKENKNKVLKLLKKYGLYEFKDKYPSSLSGGMRQRVALIRTLATNPDILLLDEPFSALDYQTRLKLSDDLYKIIKNEKKSAIMVTHDIAEAISLSQRIILLTKRPATIKEIYEINLEENNTPTENRKDKNFMKYYDAIWKELDNHV